MIYSIWYTCNVYAICILRECLLHSNAESLHFMMGPFYPNKTWTNLWTIRWRELLSHIVWTNYFMVVHVTLSKTFYSFVEFSSQGHTYSILLDLHILLNCWFFVSSKKLWLSLKEFASCIETHGEWMNLLVTKKIAAVTSWLLTYLDYQLHLSCVSLSAKYKISENYKLTNIKPNISLPPSKLEEMFPERQRRIKKQ